MFYLLRYDVGLGKVEIVYVLDCLSYKIHTFFRMSHITRRKLFSSLLSTARGLSTDSKVLIVLILYSGRVGRFYVSRKY